MAVWRQQPRRRWHKRMLRVRWSALLLSSGKLAENCNWTNQAKQKPRETCGGQTEIYTAKNFNLAARHIVWCTELLSILTNENGNHVWPSQWIRNIWSCEQRLVYPFASLHLPVNIWTAATAIYDSTRQMAHLNSLGNWSIRYCLLLPSPPLGRRPSVETWNITKWCHRFYSFRKRNGMNTKCRSLLCDGIMPNGLPRPPRVRHSQQKKNFIHFEDDDRQTAATSCELILHWLPHTWIVRIHFSGPAMCGRQMRVTMRCHHAQWFLSFWFYCLFRLDVILLLSMWSRTLSFAHIIHSNAQRQAIKFHHPIEQTILQPHTYRRFTIIYSIRPRAVNTAQSIFTSFVHSRADRVAEAMNGHIFGFDSHYIKLCKCVVDSLKFYMILAPGQHQIFDQLISLESTTKFRLQSFHIFFFCLSLTLSEFTSISRRANEAILLGRIC